VTHRDDHAMLMFATFHRAPTGPPPEHTGLVVFVCSEPGCRGVSLFPPGNFALCTEEFRTTIRAMLLVAGYEVEWDQ